MWTGFRLGGNRMTNKGAIKELKYSIEPNQGFMECRTGTISEEAIKMAIEALEKADKYRWHDLRKNPDDLPEAIGGGYESEYVLVMIGTPEWNSWEQAYYHHGKKLWSTYDQNVFAWRYIEPFKEE